MSRSLIDESGFVPSADVSVSVFGRTFPASQLRKHRLCAIKLSAGAATTVFFLLCQDVGRQNCGSHGSQPEARPARAGGHLQRRGRSLSPADPEAVTRPSGTPVGSAQKACWGHRASLLAC